MKVAIGIPTYNRRHLIELSAASLRSSSMPPGTAVIVVDDASTEYDVGYLRSIYPEFADVRRRPANSGGASFANGDVMRQLLETDADAVLLLDSDLLVSTNFLELGIALLRDTDGVLSLFNTPSHPAIGARGPFVLKTSVGCAGTLWRRDVAAAVLASVPAGEEWDWRFSEYLVKAGIEICVTRDSLVQHIGYSKGQHSNVAVGDIGVGFSDSDPRNAYRLAELLMTDSQEQSRHLHQRIEALERRARRLERWALPLRLALFLRRLFVRPES
jgi:glycosyltransferase involved in cell wall biosynthesis